MRYSIAAVALAATTVCAQQLSDLPSSGAATTSPVASYPVASSGPSSTVSGAPSGTGVAPSSTQSFVNGASSNDFKIGAAALAAIAAMAL